MNKRQQTRYMIGMMAVLIVTIVISIIPSNFSVEEKLQFATVTNIGMFSGTVAMLYKMCKSPRDKK